ncbi:MAG TPA: UvrD-helicase domain-containing protein [Candidatus Paceibacterota bacterium]|nr:UvrD-helicase domain-containing protein [Candidatus Paceibacterota bacterium]
MDYLKGLNEEQQKAVRYIDGPLLIVAGAGTGKTKTLTARIRHLIESGVNPKAILAITFTNKAAGEMRLRLDPFLEGFSERPFIGTFHSLGVKILREQAHAAGLIQNFAILDEEDALAILKDALREAGFDPKQIEPKKIKSVISWQKNHFVSREDFASRAEEFLDEVAVKVWERYEAKLKKERAVDFDDLLIRATKLLAEEKVIRDHYANSFQYINVDEYQDTNVVQDKLIRLLSPHGRVAVVGDPDQGIYSWRGANIVNILNFEKNFPGAKIIFLEENYRSTKIILEAANKVIKKNVWRQDKNLFTRSKLGEPITLFEAFDEKEEANFIVRKISELKPNLSEVAVLYRTNWQSRILEETMLRENIPYEVIGVKFFARKEIKDVLSFIRAAINPESLNDIKRIINLPPRGIGKVTLLKIFAGKINELPAKMQEKIKIFYELLAEIKRFSENHAPANTIKFIIKESGLEKWLSEGNDEDLERLANMKELVSLAKKYDFLGGEVGILKLLEDAALSVSEETSEENKNGIKLMTVHAAKGLEFDTVFVTGLEENLFPHKRREESTDLEEERRLFYVAITRARERLFLSFADYRTIFGGRLAGYPSEFLADLPPENLVLEKGEYLKNISYDE